MTDARFHCGVPVGLSPVSRWRRGLCPSCPPGRRQVGVFDLLVQGDEQAGPCTQVCLWPASSCQKRRPADRGAPVVLLHQAPWGDRPVGVQICSKGPPAPRPHEREPWNHAVSLRVDESDPGLCRRSGHPVPLLVPGALAWPLVSLTWLPAAPARLQWPLSSGRLLAGALQGGYCTRGGVYWPGVVRTARGPDLRGVHPTVDQ